MWQGHNAAKRAVIDLHGEDAHLPQRSAGRFGCVARAADHEPVDFYADTDRSRFDPGQIDADVQAMPEPVEVDRRRPAIGRAELPEMIADRAVE